MKDSGSLFRSVLRDVGGIQLLLGPTLLLPGLVSLLYGEFYSAFSFAISSAMATLFGVITYRSITPSEENGPSQAMVTAVAVWLAASFFGAFPFFIAANITPVHVADSFVPAGETYSSSLFFFKNYLNAFFESVSAYTTTGLTMSIHEPSIGKGLLFYRSFAQWLGGAGMVVLSLAVLQRSGKMHGLIMYHAEAKSKKLRPNVTQTARAIWKVYLSLTGISILYLFIATYTVIPETQFIQNLFESVNHAMAGQSTGGFSTFDKSIAHYNSYAMEMIYLVPMLLGAFSIPLYYKVYDKGSLREFWLDNQARWLIYLITSGSVLLTIMLFASFGLSQSIREGVFHFVSAMTTTGWKTADFDTWPAPAILLLATLPMIVGGSAGATAGGIKIFRIYLIAKGFAWRLKKILQPSRSIIALNLGHKRYLYKDISDDLMEAYTFSMMYLGVLLLGILVTATYAGDEFQLIDAIFESVSAQGTVGLTTGITDPSMSPVLKITFIIQMLIGRLELIPVLIMIHSLFTRSKI